MTAAAVPSGTSAPDYDAIVRVVHLYSDAFVANDVAMFEEAFHEDAWIFYTEEDGSLANCPIRTCFERWAEPAMGRAIGRVISVTQAGDIASVLLGWDRPDDLADSYVDLHNLIRLGSVWKITNKTATHASRAGGRKESGSGRPMAGRLRPASGRRSATGRAPRTDGQPGLSRRTVPDRVVKVDIDRLHTEAFG